MDNWPFHEQSVIYIRIIPHTSFINIYYYATAGDSEYKPFINAIPDVREYALDGTEDFLVLACDGLWDVLRDDDAALIVYNAIYENPGE